MTYFRTLSVAFLATATLAACSSSDDSIIDEQPVVTPTAPTTYTMTVQATKGDGTTRGLSLDDDVLNVKWNQDEEVKVVQDNTVIGTLKAAASNDGTTTLTGTLTGFKADFPLVLYLHSNVFNYEGQTGVLLNSEGGNSIEDNYDYAYCDVAVNQITVEGSKVTVNNINFESVQAIVKFTLVDRKGSEIQAKSLTIEATQNYIYQQMDIRDVNNNHRGPITIEPTTPTNVIYAAICDGFWEDNEYTLTATDADGITYTYTKSGIRFKTGKYYDVTVKMAVRGHALSVSNVGEIVCSDGLAYDLTYKDYLPTNVSAVGMVAYKNGENGLVIALNDEGGKYEWDGAVRVAKAHTPVVTGYSWKLPSTDEWRQMFTAFGGDKTSYSGLRTAINNAGGTPLQVGIGGRYWTSTENDSNYAYFIQLNGAVNILVAYKTETANFVRACFAF